VEARKTIESSEMEKSRQVDEDYKWQDEKLGEQAKAANLANTQRLRDPLPSPRTHACIKHAGSRSTAPLKDTNSLVLK
jgi:hypothetical protein